MCENLVCSLIQEVSCMPGDQGDNDCDEALSGASCSPGGYCTRSCETEGADCGLMYGCDVTSPFDSGHHATGAYEEAKALYERALAIKERARGADDRDVAATLNNLADVHEATGAYEEAKALYERALAIWDKALGPDHPDAAHALVGLAKIELQDGRPADAVPLAERARTLREAGDVAPIALAQARFVLARALVGAGRSHAEAVALAEQARDAHREAGEAAQDDLAEVERWLATHGRRNRK
jgi:tetratricopeptide (TPR) repeat protein